MPVTWVATQAWGWGLKWNASAAGTSEILFHMLVLGALLLVANSWGTNSREIKRKRSIYSSTYDETTINWYKKQEKTDGLFIKKFSSASRSMYMQGWWCRRMEDETNECSFSYDTFSRCITVIGLILGEDYSCLQTLEYNTYFIYSNE